MNTTEVKIKPHDLENVESPIRIKAILLAAGIPVVVDNQMEIKLTEPGVLATVVDHEGILYSWTPRASLVSTYKKHDRLFAGEEIDDSILLARPRDVAFMKEVARFPLAVPQ